MKETITLRNLMEAIDQITESNRLQVKDIEAFATYMSDGDEEEKEYRTLKMHQGNEFYDMKQKGFKEGNIYVVSFKAIKVMKLWIEDKKLYVETETDPNVPDDISIQTIKTYNKFLEELTGYTAKERARMMKKELE